MENSMVTSLSAKEAESLFRSFKGKGLRVEDFSSADSTNFSDRSDEKS
jgi:hypothetical protein